MAVEQLALEQRRHFRVSFGLVLACLAAAVAVQNERGVFVPVGFGGLESAAKAFAFLGPNGQPLQLMSYGPPVTPGVDQNPLPRALAARVLEPPPAPVPAGPFGGPAAQAPAFANNAAGAPGAPGAGSPGARGPGTPFSSFTPNSSPVLTPIGAGGVPNVGQDDDTDTPTNPGTPPTDNPGTPGNPGTPPTDNPGTPGENPPPGTDQPGPNQPGEQPGPSPDNDGEPRPPVIVTPVIPPVIVPETGLPGPPIDNNPETEQPPVAPVPEPATWGMMLLGFGLMGASVRARYRRRREA